MPVVREGGLRVVVADFNRPSPTIPTTKISITITISLAAVLLATQAHAQADSVARVDSIFSRWSSREVPGCAVTVARGGRTLLSRRFGTASSE